MQLTGDLNIYFLCHYQATKTATSPRMSALCQSPSKSGMSSPGLGAGTNNTSGIGSDGTLIDNPGSELEHEHGQRDAEDGSNLQSQEGQSCGLNVCVEEGLDERERTQSDDVRSIIQAATTVFVDEWHLANENHVDHREEHEGESDSESESDSSEQDLEDSLHNGNTFPANSCSDDEEREHASIKDKDA